MITATNLPNVVMLFDLRTCGENDEMLVFVEEIRPFKQFRPVGVFVMNFCSDSITSHKFLKNTNDYWKSHNFFKAQIKLSNVVECEQKKIFIIIPHLHFVFKRKVNFDLDTIKISL